MIMSANIFNCETRCLQLISLLYLMFARRILLHFYCELIFDSSLHSFITKYVTIFIETATSMLESDMVTLHCADFFKRLRNGNVK